MYGSMTKSATKSTIPARIPEIVSRAFYTAANGRPGPVVVNLSEDMLTERVGVDDAPRLRAGRDLAGSGGHGEIRRSSLAPRDRRS